jgi:hypothetical protein
MRSRTPPNVVANAERAATGLSYDHDGNPATPNVNAGGVSENTVRRDRNMPQRTFY